MLVPTQRRTVGVSGIEDSSTGVTKSAKLLRCCSRSSNPAAQTGKTQVPPPASSPPTSAATIADALSTCSGEPTVRGETMVRV